MRCFIRRPVGDMYLVVARFFYCDGSQLRDLVPITALPGYGLITYVAAARILPICMVLHISLDNLFDLMLT